MPDYASFSPPPIGAPVTGSDVAFFGRLTGQVSATGQPVMAGYTATLDTLLPGIMVPALVTAGGAGALDATRLTTAISIVVAATGNAGVQLQALASSTQAILNVSGSPVLIYPPPTGPSGAAGTFTRLPLGESIAAGAPVTVPSGPLAWFFSADGAAFFVPA